MYTLQFKLNAVLEGHFCDNTFMTFVHNVTLKFRKSVLPRKKTGVGNKYINIRFLPLSHCIARHTCKFARFWVFNFALA